MMKDTEETTAAMENSTYYSDLSGGGYGNLYSMLEGGNGSSIGGELGFLEMLGVQEYQINPMGCMFEEMVHRELLMQQSFIDQVAAAGNNGCKNGYEKKKVVVNKEGVSKQFEDGNTPGTPNSSSISLASNNEGVVVESEQEKGEEDDGDRDEDEEEKGDDDEGSDKSKNQQLKTKKSNLKKQRQPRIAFMTKSEVDHLEDGYRWRKYGQKAVKNSPFPRSYYRCTSASCGVKKRVERSCTDPSTVVTTYEGQHIHPSPLTPRSLTSAIFRDSSAFAAMPTLMQMELHSCYQQQQSLLPSYFASLPPYHSTYYHTSSLTAPNFTTFTHSPGATNVNLSSSNQSFTRDQGLLQDLIPSLVPKEE